MSKKPKTISQIRDDFRRSMQKTANKGGVSISFSVTQDGVEKKLVEFKPTKK